MRSIALTLIALPALTLAVPAQQKKVIPSAAATQDGSTQTPYFSGYGAGIAQQIIDAAAVARGAAIINELALRADGSNLVVVPSRSFTQLKLSLGYTSLTPATMSSTFASNRTGQQTVMFSGAYNLPAQDAISRPFNIPWKFTTPFLYATANGNLLVEFEVPGPATKSNYFLDAHQDTTSGGTATPFGTAGSFFNPEVYRVSCADVSQLKPGGSAQLLIASFVSQYPAVAIWGFSNKQFGPLPLPFDLTVLGAPGNFLNVSMDLVLPMSLTMGSGGWEARSTLPIPSLSALRGLTIFAQGLFIDAKANTLGWVLSQGLAMTLERAGVESRLLGTYDSTQATGSLLPVGTGMVMQLTGVFP
jgi:hypothetical protein